MGIETALLVAGGGALIGGIAGSMKDTSETKYDSRVDAGTANTNEQYGTSLLTNSVKGLEGLVNAGPGQQDVAAATGGSRDLASMLQQMSQTGGLPGAGDISAANNIATQMFQAQQLGLQQAFSDQNTNASRQAALMGRDANDPILRAKLAQEQTRQQGMLGAQQGAWAQNLALQLPGQRLGYAEQRANVLSGLATQAMANRQALAAMGEGIQTNERNFRLQTARRYGSQTTESGGGVKGALTGALAGAGAGMNMAAGFAGMPGIAQAAAPSLTAAAPQMALGYGAASNFFGAPNPFGMAGQGLQLPQAPSNPFGGSFQMGSQFGGGPRTFSLGGF